MKSKRYKIFIHWVCHNLIKEDLITMIEIPEEYLIETLKNIISIEVDRIEVLENEK